jgi:hypothetical protein
LGSSPGAIAVADKAQRDDMEPEDKATAQGSLAAYLDASSSTKTSSIGVAALASASAAHSNTTARVSNIHGLARATKQEKSGDASEVGAKVVRGLSPHDSYESASTSSGISNGDSFKDPPQAIYEENAIQATLVADRVTSYDEEADVEAQVQARMRSEAQAIADMVHSCMLQNAAVGVVQTEEETKPGGANIEGDNRMKKICILLVAALVVAGAIGAGVGVPLSKESPVPVPPPTTPGETSPPVDTSESFRKLLDSLSGESLDDETSPQSKALNWIANDDPANMSVQLDDNEIIKQRYVAAVLYFALGGDSWTNPHNFLSVDEICSWNTNQVSGIICSATTDNVVTLRLSKSKREVAVSCQQ